MKQVLISLFFILLPGAKILQAQVPGSAVVDTSKKHIIILTAFDGNITRHPNVTYVEDRSAKEKDLFQLLADSLKQILATRIKANYNQEPDVIDNIIQTTGNTDSAIHTLMKIKNATFAIVIREFTVYFAQTGVSVEKSDGSKTRTATYDICSCARYRFYSGENKMHNSEINKCEYFTERQVLSGLFAAGPNILKKKKDAFKQVPKNANLYLMEINSELK